MTRERWAAVDDVLADALLPHDDVLDATLERAAAAGLPPHHVSPLQGAWLHLLARATRARNVLEIGTLAGYSAIHMGRALLDGGRMITIESDPRHAAVARESLAAAGLDDVVDVREGAASDVLPALEAEGRGPFDMVFIDADKERCAEYFAGALRLSRRGTVIVVDNVVRGGAVADPENRDPRVRGVRLLLEAVASEPRVRATALQTVGSKGWDGFLAALVVEGDA